ncbi:hypothetical protein KK466_29605, partial [Klebsiella pneumoniae]|uniref:hypothetical protein n=1 Tax=Klebsiella pneumoniae TaxID=573 RepID=UPI001BE02D74
DMPISFSGYALEITAYLLNKVPSKSVPKTSYEIWYGKKPSLKHLKVWVVLHTLRTKLQQNWKLG